jgi:hypothetical protein
MRFADIATKKLEETERPPLPPIGSYVMEVTAATITTRTSASGTFDIIEFSLKGVSPLDDVDIDDLAKFGGAKGVIARHSFIFNTAPTEELAFLQTENRLKKFVREHLLLPLDEAPDYSSIVALSKGRNVIVEIGHRPDKSEPDILYTEVKKTMPL